MEQLLQQFEKPIVDKSGVSYTVFLYGRTRPGDTWQGWLVFERFDGKRFATDVETTQPNADTILYWAGGLTSAYFDGALERALRSPQADRTAVAAPAPLGASVDSAMRKRRLGKLESAVLSSFQRHATVRLRTDILLNELPYAHADTIRALEDLEKQGGLLVRRTEEGSDWLFLTEAGAVAAGVEGIPHETAKVPRELPKPAR
jgi:hypothetical protein